MNVRQNRPMTHGVRRGMMDAISGGGNRDLNLTVDQLWEEVQKIKIDVGNLDDLFDSAMNTKVIKAQLKLLYNYILYLHPVLTMAGENIVDADSNPVVIDNRG